MRTRQTGMARNDASRVVAAAVATLAAAALAVAGCANGRQVASGRVVPPTSPSASTSSGSSRGGAPIAPVPSGGTSSLVPIPKPPTAASHAIPADATVVSASYVADQLGVVTDRNMFGPITVTNADVVARAASAINDQPAQRAVLLHCPQQGPGGMTLQFKASANGPVIATAVINSSGCQGVLVRTPNGGIAALSGGPALIRSLESILGVNWPRPTG